MWVSEDFIAHHDHKAFPISSLPVVICVFVGELNYMPIVTAAMAVTWIIILSALRFVRYQSFSARQYVYVVWITFYFSTRDNNPTAAEEVKWSFVCVWCTEGVMEWIGIYFNTILLRPVRIPRSLVANVPSCNLYNLIITTSGGEASQCCFIGKI